MILSGKEIKRQLGTGIKIVPYNESQLNPNSYNLSLFNEWLTYDKDVLDMKNPNPTTRMVIPEEGWLLEPNKWYLGKTNEHTSTDKFVPMLEGR